MAEQEITSEKNQTGKIEVTGVRRRKFVECAQETFEQASELLKQKIPCVGHILAPKRLWLKRISTPNCDVVVEFPPNSEDSVLLWLLSRLRQSPGLTVHVRHHASTQSSAFYLTAPFQILLRAAEEYHLTKALKASKGGGLKEFAAQDLQYFECADNEELFFTSQERQWLVLRILQSVRAKLSDTKALPGIHLLEGQPLVPKCLSAGIISQIFPLHESSNLEKLQNAWVRDISARQPLDDIAEYFGVKIAMYFAWLGHYTTALSIPAFVGLLFWLCCNGKHQNLEDIGYVVFSIFNIVWVTSYSQAWKRYSAELAFRWGTLDQRNDLLAEPRPLFRGPLQTSAVTGRLEPWQPAWKRHVYRYCVTVPMIVVCLSAVFIVMIVSLHIQDWWDNQLQVRGYPMWLGYLPKIMLAVVITLMDEAYFKIALWLNDKENYRLETKYENHLIGKVALFQFINSFLSLFYIAFYLQDQARLKEQLAALFISRQVIGNLKESALPYMLEHMRLAKMSFDMWGALSPTTATAKPLLGNAEGAAAVKLESTTATPLVESGGGGDVVTSAVSSDARPNKRSMSQAELETSLYKYDGTFSEHLEMTIQLGYVILFSSAFPPAAICAIFNNMIEIRSDAFKLAYVCQRPFGQRVPNIGTWQNCMEYMSIIAVLVNCALIGLSGQVHRMFPDMTATQTILLIVALEHIMLCIRFIITCAIPDIPGWLATEMAKIEWARREASRIGNTATPSPEDLTSKLIGRFSVSPSHSLVTAAAQRDIPQTVDEASDVPSPVLPKGGGGVVTPPQGKATSKRGSAASITSNTSNAGGGGGGGTPTSPGPVSGGAGGQNRSLMILPGSIQQIPPFKPRKSKDWGMSEGGVGGELTHHLTIGPSGGAEWAKRLKDTVSPVDSSQLPEVHRSTDCITPSRHATSSTTSTAAAVSSSGLGGGSTTAIPHHGGVTAASSVADTGASTSDSDLLRGSPVWPPRPREPQASNVAVAAAVVARVAKQQKEKEKMAEKVAEKEKEEVAVETEEQAAVRVAAEELAAKKTRVKQSLMKRARSVAIFSLKLKERRAREAAEKANKPPVTPTTPLPPPQCGGGELSCIPIEKLIQLEDLRQIPQQRSGSTS